MRSRRVGCTTSRRTATPRERSLENAERFEGRRHRFAVSGTGEGRQNPRPILFNTPVATWPSVTLKSPGYFFAQSLLAWGQYWRLFPSTAATVGMRAASEADCRNEAPGHVRSCTQRNILNFCAAAASSNESVCPLHVLSATPL